MTTNDQPSLYNELAEWWPLLSQPSDYAEEAELYIELLTTASSSPPVKVLELGSGGGNNASHMKHHFTLTLSDLSNGMLEVSRRLNPECEHVQGDMRTIRLGSTFDAVFAHDAVAYLTTKDDLRAMADTAFTHLRPGGVALIVPDFIKENFQAGTDEGGHDDPTNGRGLRYLEWTWDPDPNDNTYLVDYAYLLRDEAGEVRVVHDRHTEGLFSRQTWLGILAQAGFEARCEKEPPRDWPQRDLFIALRPL
jgi:trans-aconitate methyltransferase